ncbi:hypothetical protein [Robbsia andropogonis]|uniref:hypothetical protein n=1 Tax=Robbsia andropogonis TaxID=28092 RepID=UPI0020A1CF58|nr:hypothetical protein [Robbsia andropogonis]MCP1119630.1 hypothetical protein [Robbsia andropogonis]MCP1129613.1 hypothetical protein [Robbsia andropogonis]
MRNILWLARHGVPFDVAAEMSPTMRFACSVIVSEQGGREFNWRSMTFVEPPKQ